MTDGLVFCTHPMSRGRIVRRVGVRSIRDVRRQAKFDSDPDFSIFTPAGPERRR